MPFEMNCYQDKGVIHLRFFGNVTAEEIENSVPAIRQCVETNHRLTHYIIEIADLPQRFNDVVNVIQHITRIDNQHQGWAIIVCANPIVALVAATVGQVAQPRLHAVKSLDSAFGFLKNIEEASFAAYIVSRA